MYNRGLKNYIYSPTTVFQHSGRDLKRASESQPPEDLQMVRAGRGKC